MADSACADRSDADIEDPAPIGHVRLPGQILTRCAEDRGSRNRPWGPGLLWYPLGTATMRRGVPSSGKLLQALRIDRLGPMVIETRLRGQLLVLLLAPPGPTRSAGAGALPPAPDAARRFVAVDAGQADVEQHDVRLEWTGRRRSTAAKPSCTTYISLPSSSAAVRPACSRRPVVVDHQDATARGRSDGSAAHSLRGAPGAVEFRPAAASAADQR